MDPSIAAPERIRAVAQAISLRSREYDKRRDPRAVFAFVYHQITEDLARYMASSESRFDDPAWVATLTEAFAGRFFQAMTGIDDWLAQQTSSEIPPATAPPTGKPTPWDDVQAAIRDRQAYVLEELLFSMMAHISYDLPLALLEAGLREHGTSHIRDYHQMNTVLGNRTEEIQRAVGRRYNPFLGYLDKIAGHYDEFFTNYGMRLARSAAWYNACRLLDPASSDEARQSIERSTAGFIDFVRNPKGRWLRLLIKAVRIVIPRFRRWPNMA